MTWAPHDPAAPQDPRWSGQQGSTWQTPPPGGMPPGPPPPGYGPPPGYPPPPPGYPPPAPMWMPPPAFPLAPDAYPVNLSYDRAAVISRLWGIPFVGVFVRWVLLIPHFIVLALLGIVAAFQMLFTWIPVLMLGRFPGWGYRWIGGLMAWTARVQAYAMLMTPTYPPFSLSGEGHPVVVRFDEGVRINRLWGIPVLGLLVRGLILIPHYLVLALLAILVGVVAAFTWIPVLLLGRQADFVYTVVGGYNRWLLRVNAYLLRMVDRYPPFSLGEDDPRL